MEIPSQAEIIKERERRSYAYWYKRHIPKQYGFPRHIEYLCEVAQKVIDGEWPKVCISTPPGHAKSETITCRLPVYWGLHHPNDVAVFTGYNDTFARKNLSKPARDIAEEYGWLQKDSDGLDEWYLKNGARLVSRGVGTPPTGVNPISLLVADDPISSRKQAESEVERDNIWNWWVGSILQRFWPRTRALVIATRWHEDDLIGRIKATNNGSWKIINLPAIAQEDDPMGRKPGEALWPEEKPIEFLMEQQAAMGGYEFEALFQGNPTPLEGALFKIMELGTREKCPDGYSVLEFDYGSTTKGDYTACGQVWEDPVTGKYIVDVARVQLEPYARDVWMRSQADVRLPGLINLPQDPGAAGKSQAETHVKMLAGHNVQVASITGDKVTRAMPFASQVNAGNVEIVDGPYRKDFIEELRQFPNGKYDDMIDAVSGAFNQLCRRKQKTRSLARPGFDSF